MSSKVILSKLKQSSYCIILIVSSDASNQCVTKIDVQELQELQQRISYSYTMFCNNITIMLTGQNIYERHM